MKNIIIAIAVAILGFFGVTWSVLNTEPVAFEGTTNLDSLSLSETLTVTGDSVFSGGTLNVTTANTATSTVVAGCYQFYATSTATAQKFQASTTPGVMYSSYGTCPNL